MKNLLVPEDIIRSVKDEKNKTLLGKTYAAISNERAFMSLSNIEYIVKHIYLLHRKNGGTSSRNIFEKALPSIMKLWAAEENLDSFEGWNNYHWVLTMDYINKKFIKDHASFYTVQGADTNVFKMHVPVGTLNEFDGKTHQTKKYDQMTAADYQNLDVYGPMEAFTQNKEVYRYKNKIPVWQRSMNKHHFSRENEGFRSNNWARASLEVPVRGYGGQPNITEATRKYEDPMHWVDI